MEKEIKKRMNGRSYSTNDSMKGKMLQDGRCTDAGLSYSTNDLIKRGRTAELQIFRYWEKYCRTDYSTNDLMKTGIIAGAQMLVYYIKNHCPQLLSPR